MGQVYIDRDGAEITVRWYQGARPIQERRFADRTAAESFAEAKMGMRGSILSTLDLTPEQMAAHRARQARIAANARAYANMSDRYERDAERRALGLSC